MTEESQRSEALDRAEAAGYLPHIRSIVQRATMPIWWSRASSPIGSAVLHNGTVCALDTGERTICVTASHVYSEYLAHKREFNDLECQVGSVRIDLEAYVIDSNPSLDLATFDIPPILLAGSRISAHGAPNWPPKQLAESEIVVLGGYPGVLRVEEHGQLVTPFLSYIARVAQSSQDHSAIQLIEGIQWAIGSETLPPESELGGLSGGPVFRYVANPVEYFELAGFIYEAHTSYGIVFARHASCINAAGKIADF